MANNEGVFNKDLQYAIAEHIYEKQRQSLIFVAPQLPEWKHLTKEQQEQFAGSMRMWLMGIGSNEVAAEWYNRSGHFPKWFWEQMPDVEHESIFAMAGIQMLFRLVELAEQTLQSQFSQHELIMLDLSVMDRLFHAKEIYELLKESQDKVISKSHEKLSQQNISNLEALHQKLMGMIEMDNLKEPEA